MEKLKYPIGRFVFNEIEIAENKGKLIAELSNFPTKLQIVLNEVSEKEEVYTYRENGWTIRQLVHHLSDSHANMYIRVKSALAKDENTIMGYDENAWSLFADNEVPLEYSIKMLEGIHHKVSHLFKNMSEFDLQKKYFHNSDERFYTLLEVLGLYVWHGNHHLEHINVALKTGNKAGSIN